MIATVLLAAVVIAVLLLQIRGLEEQVDHLTARLDLALPTGSDTPLHDELMAARFRRQLDAGPGLDESSETWGSW